MRCPQTYSMRDVRNYNGIYRIGRNVIFRNLLNPPTPSVNKRLGDGINRVANIQERSHYHHYVQHLYRGVSVNYG